MSEEINVPLLDLRAQYDMIRDEIEPILRDVVESQWFVMGPKVADFEQAVAEYCGAKHAVGCASGSDSLLLALMASDIGPGDEVICPSYTFFATAGSIWRLERTDLLRYRSNHVQLHGGNRDRCDRPVQESQGHHAGPSLWAGCRSRWPHGIGLRKRSTAHRGCRSGHRLPGRHRRPRRLKRHVRLLQLLPIQESRWIWRWGHDHDERFGRRRSNASTSESWNGTQVLSRRSGSEFETRRALRPRYFM